MAEYNIVKYCRLCKKRYLVDKSEKRKHYCSKYQKIADKND